MTMIPAGYMSKKIALRPEWLKANGVEDICAVSDCISKPFADYINYWKHNGYWFFNSADDIERLCQQENIGISENTLFYYEVFDREFDEETRSWSPFEPEHSFPTHVQKPECAALLGYDVATFAVRASPECSPLSCNSLATEIAINRHCLFDTFEQAVDDSEPGPFRVFAVYRLEL